MSFKFHTFNKKPFSATNFISKVKEQNYQTNNFNINNFRSIKLTNNIEHNKQIKKLLLERDLEDELLLKKNYEKSNSNNFEYKTNLINEIIPLMLAYNCYLPDQTTIDTFKRSENDIEFSNIISCFQLLLKYLFETKENNENQNNLIEQNLALLKENANLLNNDISILNNNKISELENRKIQLLLFLKKNGKDLEIKNNNLYVCNVCPFPYKKYYSYRDFHRHYVKNHINPNIILNNDYEFINQGFDKAYFDNKINEFSEEITQLFEKTNIDIKKNNINCFIKQNIFGLRRNKRYETVGPNNTNVDFNRINRTLYNNDFNEKNKETFRKRIEIIENRQKNFENNFKNQINIFLEEFKNEILKLKDN